ncbi:N-formylglutamate amidohydrolase [Paraburkholderia sp. JPY465]
MIWMCPRSKGFTNPKLIDLNVDAEGPLTDSFQREHLCARSNPSGLQLRDPLDYHEVLGLVTNIWQPFHDAVSSEISRLSMLHDEVVVLVIHAEQRLKGWNFDAFESSCIIATDLGQSTGRPFLEAFIAPLNVSGHSWVVNPWYSRAATAHRYGAPANGVHVIEAEIGARLRNQCELTERSPRKWSNSDGYFAGHLLFNMLHSICAAAAASRMPGVSRLRFQFIVWANAYAVRRVCLSGQPRARWAHK